VIDDGNINHNSEKRIFATDKKSHRLHFHALGTSSLLRWPRTTNPMRRKDGLVGPLVHCFKEDHFHNDSEPHCYYITVDCNETVFTLDSVDDLSIIKTTDSPPSTATHPMPAVDGSVLSRTSFHF
jgi:hypothetical protein